MSINVSFCTSSFARKVCVIKHLLGGQMVRIDETKRKEVMAFVMGKIAFCVKKPLCLQSDTFDVSLCSMYILKEK